MDRERCSNGCESAPFFSRFFFPRRFFLFKSTLRRPRCHSSTEVVSFFQRENYHLLRRPQFQSERQDFLHESQPVRELRVQSHTLLLVANTQPHQVVALKLWTRLALPLFFVQRPRPCQVLIPLRYDIGWSGIVFSLGYCYTGHRFYPIN